MQNSHYDQNRSQATCYGQQDPHSLSCTLFFTMLQPHWVYICPWDTPTPLHGISNPLYFLFHILEKSFSHDSFLTLLQSLIKSFLQKTLLTIIVPKYSPSHCTNIPLPNTPLPSSSSYPPNSTS